MHTNINKIRREGNFYYNSYFDWKITLNSEQNTYNWFGISDYLKETVILNLIDEEQTYNYFELIGDLDFKDSLIEKSKAQISYFSDAFESREIFASFNTKFSFPLYFISNNLIVDTNIEYLNGNFKQDYLGNNVIDYSIFTLKINPKYAFNLNDFSFKGGFKTYVSLDTENSATNILIYPEFTVTKPIIKNTINAYLGATGDLKTNTYKRFTEENPYVSPTLFITQTSEKINAFFGVNGSINNVMSFNFKTSYKQEEDKPLFIRNNSKSNGTVATANSNSLKGYEYGNSFKIFYDNVKTLSLFGEFTYDISKKITTNLNIEYNSYTVSKHYEAWNLPEIQAAIIGKYKADKWYATTNIFYVGERNIVTYNGQFPSSLATPSTLSSFVDFNYESLNDFDHTSKMIFASYFTNNILSNYKRLEFKPNQKVLAYNLASFYITNKIVDDSAKYFFKNIDYFKLEPKLKFELLKLAYINKYNIYFKNIYKSKNEFINEFKNLSNIDKLFIYQKFDINLSNFNFFDKFLDMFNFFVLIINILIFTLVLFIVYKFKLSRIK